MNIYKRAKYYSLLLGDYVRSLKVSGWPIDNFGNFFVCLGNQCPHLEVLKVSKYHQNIKEIFDILNIFSLLPLSKSEYYESFENAQKSSTSKVLYQIYVHVLIIYFRVFSFNEQNVGFSDQVCEVHVILC